MIFWKDLHSREWKVIEKAEMNDIQGTGETTASGRNIEALRIAFNLGLIKLSTLYAHQWVDNSMTFFFFFAWVRLSPDLRYQVAKAGKNSSQFLSHPPPDKTAFCKIIIFLEKKKKFQTRCSSLGLALHFLIHLLKASNLRDFLGGWESIFLQCRRSEFDTLGWEDPLHKEMAIHSNILAWRIPGTEEPVG